ncbi:MAG: glycosyltransferase family 4 protein [Chloracidobacterium sp.]|nr:glycosyltransferase family 4 protein [Chloracidobacterium sp.]
MIEYMAAGLPVVATDVGGAKEAIEDGETGYLVRSDDDEALSACIIKILEDKALSDRLGQRGKEIAFTRFSAERQTDSVLSLYESVLKDR